MVHAGIPKSDDDSYNHDAVCYPIAELTPFRDTMLLQSPSGSIFVLNESSIWLWRELCHGASLGEVSLAFSKRYQLPIADAEADIEKVIGEWEDHDLIGLEPAASMPATMFQQTPDLAMTCQLGEQAVLVRSWLPDISEKIEDLFEPSKVDVDPPPSNVVDIYYDDGGYFVANNKRIIYSTSDIGYARGALLYQVIRLSWPARRWLSCLHGSAVGNDTSCLVLSGECGAGKSTLTAALVHAGFSLLSDDTVPIECDDHLVWPLPLSMSIKESGIAIWERFFPEIAQKPVKTTDRGLVRYHFPADRAYPVDAGGLPVHALIFPRYLPDGALSLDAVDQRQALEWLCANGSSLDLSGHNLRESLSWLDETPCYTLTYSCLDSAVDMLTKLWAEG